MNYYLFLNKRLMVKYETVYLVIKYKVKYDIFKFNAKFSDV